MEGPIGGWATYGVVSLSSVICLILRPVPWEGPSGGACQEAGRGIYRRGIARWPCMQPPRP